MKERHYKRTYTSPKNGGDIVFRAGEDDIQAYLREKVINLEADDENDELKKGLYFDGKGIFHIFLFGRPWKAGKDYEVHILINSMPDNVNLPKGLEKAIKTRKFNLESCSSENFAD